MKHRTPHILSVLSMVFLAVWFCAASARGDVIKNKKTGETLKGALTKQRINNLNVFRTDLGETKYINLSEWEIIERSEDKTTAQTQEPAEQKQEPLTTKGTPDEQAGPVVNKAYVIPISGPIMEPCILEGLAKAIAAAKAAGANIVVLRMNTPGGRVDIADKIIQMIEGIDWAQTVAWVKGDEKHALSAGAYICLATNEIFMCSGSTIGAATPFTVSDTGSAQVDEKMTSAFRARFRSLAQQRGHPAALADAMVDNSQSVVQVWVEGQQMLVPEDEAQRLEKEHVSDGKFKRGKTVSREGKLVTLTSDEAREYGVCRAVVDSIEDLGEALSFDPKTVENAEWLVGWTEQEGKKRAAEADKYRTIFNTHFEQVQINDPRAQRYTVMWNTSSFADGGKRWREYTDKCLAHLKECAGALLALEKMSQSERYNFYVPPEMISEMKARMTSMFSRLRDERDGKQLP